MTGSARILLVTTFATVVLAALFFHSSGSNETAPIARRFVDVHGVDGNHHGSSNADLIDVRRDIQATREIASTGGGDAVSGATREETSSVAGTVQLPRTFPRGTPGGDPTIELTAWSVESGDRNVAPANTAAAMDGGWRFEGLVPGTWLITARAEAGGHIATATSAPIDLDPGQSRSGIRLALEEFVVTGTVTNSAGLPLRGIRVRYEWHGSDRRSVPSNSNSALVVDFGTVTQLSGRSLNVARSREVAPSFGLPTALLSDVSSSMNGEVDAETLKVLLAAAQQARSAQSESRFKNSRGATLSSLSLPSEVPIEYVGNSPLSYAASEVVTDASGQFQVALEGPGRVELQAPAPSDGQDKAKPEYLRESKELTLTSDAPHMAVDFMLLRPATVFGHVVSVDGTKDNISLFLRPSRRSSRTQSSDEDGAFRYDELRPGRYNFYARTGGKSGQDFSFASIFDLREGEDKMVNEVLVASSSFEGILTDESGQRISGARVTALGADNSNLKRSGKTDAQGLFRIPGMYAGEYVLSVSGYSLRDDSEVYVAPRGTRADIGVLIVRPAAERNGSR